MRCGERGQTLVEFAAVSIVVLLVIVGILETGRLMLDYVTLAEAARACVRYAIVRGVDVSGTTPPTGDVQTVVQNTGSLAGLTLNTPAVDYAPCLACGGIPDAVGSTVTVTTSYTFAPITPLSSRLGVTITSTSQGTITF